MVDIAAFMVICYLGFKFLRWAWPHRATVRRVALRVARVAGIGALVLFSVGAAVWIWRYHPISPLYLFPLAFLLLRVTTRSKREAQPTATQADTQQFKGFMGMGR